MNPLNLVSVLNSLTSIHACSSMSLLVSVAWLEWVWTVLARPVEWVRAFCWLLPHILCLPHALVILNSVLNESCSFSVFVCLIVLVCSVGFREEMQRESILLWLLWGLFFFVTNSDFVQCKGFWELPASSQTSFQATPSHLLVPQTS